MKYRIVYTILGPGGIVEAPNVPSPVEAPDLKSVLDELSKSLVPMNFGLELIGIKIFKEREQSE